MKNKSIKKLVLILFAFLLFWSCSDTREKSSGEESNVNSAQPVIAVTNYPLSYFSETIAPRAKIIFPSAEADDPAFWKPTADEIVALQKADLIMINGASYENWLNNFTLPMANIVNTTKNVQNKLLKIEKKVTHSHGKTGEHEHSETAFTTWLDFEIAKQQAEAVKNSLVKKYPGRGTEFEENFVNLSKNLELLNSKLKKLAEKLKEKTLFASHPVYQYLESGYGVKIISEHWEPDQEPSQHDWEHFKNKLKVNKSDIMLWESAPLPSVEAELEKMGLKVVVFNPSGNTPDDGDFISEMSKNINNLNAAL